jgi:hypothetical protein
MRSKYVRYFFTLLIVVLLFSGWNITQAAPAPEKLVVNHETKECATIFGGDECMDCLPPDGWEVLGWSYDVECPEGYAFTEVEEICTPYKNEFCCTEGHSGAHGDCEDMVINRIACKCAFVEDINACNLPLGWQDKPEKKPNYGWACPGSFDWTEEFECQGESASDQGDADSGSGWLPFRCGGSILGILLIPLTFLFLLSPKFYRQQRQGQEVQSCKNPKGDSETADIRQ